MPEHVITLRPSRPLWTGDPTWRAVCSCGRYRSKRRVYPGHAEAAGLEHARAKGGQR